MKTDELLPIGSVVLLKKGKKRVMIIGYFGIGAEDPKDLYDYTACMFPEGLLQLNQVLSFKKEEIKDIYYRGYSDKETKAFYKIIDEFKKKYVKNGKLIKSIQEIINETKNGRRTN